MSLAGFAVNKRTITNFSAAIFLVTGILCYSQLGQLEDPEFTVKTAAIVTPYPGATAEEVELEITDRLEQAVQEMQQVKEIESFSRAGVSLIKVYIKPNYTSDKLPQVWDELRKKVRDAKDQLPPGAGNPSVGDDYGDVFGFLMALVRDGFTNAELESYADQIKKELSLVKGVAKVSLWGVQSQCIYLDVSEARLSQLGLTPLDMQNTLRQQNLVVYGGGMDMQGQRMRFETTGEFTSPEEIGDLVVLGQNVQAGASGELLRIRDIATVRRGYVEPPSSEMRYNGKPAVGIAISNVSGENIVNLGLALDARLSELKEVLPVGIEFSKISWQGDLVSESIVNFIVSLLEAVGIVLVVLWLAMGFRTAVIVGLCGLVYTIIITLLFMKSFSIDLQRMSLGALVIAMGMMVDNCIVVVDGIVVRLQQGMERVKAAVESATLPSIPLLGATVVAVMAFYPIAASDEGAGEYCVTLFYVVGLSLMISWVLSVTVTPVMCIALLPKPKAGGDQGLYGGKFYGGFRSLLRLCIKLRWLVVLIFVGLLFVSGFGFQFVSKMFFPASARPQFMIDYWMPEGSRIQQVSTDIQALEQELLASDMVDCISTYVGMGPPRFYLPVDPESPYPSYGQIIVNVHDYRDVDGLLAHVESWTRDHVSEARVIPRKYGLGPSETWAVEVRFSGPAEADPDTLRRLADQAQEIIARSSETKIVRTNWRQRVKKVVLDFDQDNARWTGVARSHVAEATRKAYDGVPVGTFREQDKYLPILLRHVEPERQTLAGKLDVLQVRPPLSSESVPLSQVTDAIAVEWEDPLIWRWDRRRAITVQAVPKTLANLLRDDIAAEIEAMDLPPGYRMMWDGEYRSSTEAQASLIPGVIPAVVIMALIIVGLFNAYKPPLIIVCLIPFALIGVTIGLLVTGQPFGFVALLGAMSLAGMMIKNAIVLLDQVNLEKAEGKSPYEAVVTAAVSRLRPVVLAAATTVLGVIPLLQDVFWVSMAVTIMFGLTFGTVITMVLLPVLYACFFKVSSPAPQEQDHE
jgi:multidrug efflux pump subunit AcrB